ncbi:Reverse transcriptase (RNA-dependent DNA polymerase) [Streptomyces yunnanensis]|uniref:Reverse transcriptase (RNA-dependent DNA polymerase) n=1 Tax=Streptomyces yunnanensis TaxID=156453 RepID=A0A9X8R0G8_9ACTN|nr:Reverse transcriptase (RNA-dependent DNA polymerase) [Streptomyces yunnanensis]
MTTAAAPKEKLDAPASAGVNGPEGGFFMDWDSIDWNRAQENVRRVRQRIFTASKDEDLAKVRNPQKLMLRSLSNTLIGVRRVTEVNGGRKTAGVDRQLVLTAPGKAELARFIQQRGNVWRARPVRRVFIYNTLNGKNLQRLWILDADLAAAFDRIDHDHLLAQLGTFPARGMVRQWLKAGVVERGRFTPTEEGTPQGRGDQPCAPERRPPWDGDGRGHALLPHRSPRRSEHARQPGRDQIRRRSGGHMPQPQSG